MRKTSLRFSGQMTRDCSKSTRISPLTPFVYTRRSDNMCLGEKKPINTVDLHRSYSSWFFFDLQWSTETQGCRVNSVRVTLTATTRCKYAQNDVPYANIVAHNTAVTGLRLRDRRVRITAMCYPVYFFF